MNDRELNELIAARILGWKWMAHTSIPIKGTPDYPTKRRVRIFLPPSSIKDGMEPATGEEPLDYCYCSSSGWPEPPWCAVSVDACLAHIVPEMLKRGMNFSLINTPSGVEAVFYTREEIESRSRGKSPARAICKAALKVIEATQ